MLRLESVSSDKHPDKSMVSYPLLTGKTYTIGRKASDIVLPDDSSISRKHAEVVVEHPAGNINEPLLTPVLTLVDVGSKFGTFPTAHNIETSQQAAARDKITISIGERIRFGLQWNEFQVSYVPFVVTTSSYKPTQEFYDKIVKLGGHCVGDWEESVTHVVMESLSLTVKVVSALLSAKPIVTPGFVADLLSSFETQKRQPSPQNYLPPIIEREISSMAEENFYPNAERTMLFGGKTFLFFTNRHLKKLAGAVKAGGGTAKTVLEAAQQNVANNEFLIIGSPTDVATGEKNPKIKVILEMYRKAGKRCIPESELGLAAVYNSAEKFCNPYFKMGDSIMPTLKDTQNPSERVPLIVPETQEVSNQSSSPEKNTSKNMVEESKDNIDLSDCKDDDDEVIECPVGDKRRPSSRSTNEKRTIDEENSGSTSSKKRSAAESLPGPNSKRKKESPHSSALPSAISSQKTDSSKALKSLFNFSDSEDEEEDESTKPETTAEKNETTIARDSQLPKVNVVSLRQLQSASRLEDSEMDVDDSIFRVPSSPPPPTEKGRAAIVNPGTDDVSTVHASLMDAKTLPAQEPEPIRATRGSAANKRNVDSSISNAKTHSLQEPEPETSRALRAKATSKRNVHLEERTPFGSKKRPRVEDANVEDKLVEKARKLDIQADGRTAPEDLEPKITPLPFVRKPLINPNLKSLEITLLNNTSNAGKGGRNFKTFRKVLPTFVSKSAASSGQSHDESMASIRKRLNSSIESLRKSKPVRLVVLDFHPGSTGYFPMNYEENDADDNEPFSDAPRFAPLIQFPEESTPPEASTSRQKNANGKNSKDNGNRRTSPRKRATQDADKMPPPPAPIMMEEEEDDMWSFR